MKWALTLLYIIIHLSSQAQYIDSATVECTDQTKFIFRLIPDFITQYYWDVTVGGEIVADWNHGVEVNLLNKTGTYIISAYGISQECYTDTSYYKITLLDCKLVYIPNAFTPNNDGENDIFFIRGNVELAIFKIYNRWGENIFSTRDIHQGWNGEYRYVPCPMGVYVYYIIVIHEGKEHLYKGNITLIR